MTVKYFLYFKIFCNYFVFKGFIDLPQYNYLCKNMVFGCFLTQINVNLALIRYILPSSIKIES